MTKEYVMDTTNARSIDMILRGNDDGDKLENILAISSQDQKIIDRFRF